MINQFFEGMDYSEVPFKALIPEYYPDEYKKYIAEEVELLKFKLRDSRRVLEAGVGIGRLIPFIAPIVGELIGLDKAELMIKLAEKIASDYNNVTIVKDNFNNISNRFEKNYFDKSLCVWNTLGNVVDEVDVLKNISEVTKDEIIVTVYMKGTIANRKNWYKTVGIDIEKIDEENEIFYSKSGLQSKSYSLKDVKEIAVDAGLKIKESKVLNGLILWVVFIKK